MLPPRNFPRINNTKGTVKYEHYATSRARSGLAVGSIANVPLGGRTMPGEILFFFTDEHGVEHAGVTVDRLFLVRKVANIVS